MSGLVRILTTGGTIASRYDPAQGGIVPALTGEELIAAVPGIAEVARLETESICCVHSADITPEIWMRLLERVRAAEADRAVTGIVVTHGTDTMEETAYFLDLAAECGKPIVLAGAQRAASYFDTDGPRNLLDAVRVACSPEAVGKGVMIVMNGQIHAAREVTKTSTLQRETFQTPEFGPLGVADPDQVRFYRAPLRRETIPLPPSARLGRVEIVPHYAGADGSLIHSLLDRGPRPDGLVIAATGSGNVNPPMEDAIARALKEGIPVVITSRVHTGRALPLYAGKGKAVNLEKLGCTFADNLSPQKARVRLLLTGCKR